MPSYKKILLTGAGGFIGKNILEQLGSKYQILAPSRQELDLLDEAAVQDYFSTHEFDVVIHAASIGVLRQSANLPGIANANTKMFLNIAEHLKNEQRMIFLGSGAEYGKQLPIIKVKEDDFGRTQPLDEYGRAKYFASQYIENHQNIVSLRCFGVYGKYEDYRTRFISNAIVEALAGRSIIIKQNVCFDYLYVDDLVKILDYFIDHKIKYKFYNTASGQRVQLITLAKIVEQQTGSKKGIVVLKEGLNLEYTADNSRLMEELGDFKFTPFEKAIGDMVNWYRQNPVNVGQSKINH